jgi:hypothetical protein
MRSPGDRTSRPDRVEAAATRIPVPWNWVSQPTATAQRSQPGAIPHRARTVDARACIARGRPTRLMQPRGHRGWAAVAGRLQRGSRNPLPRLPVWFHAGHTCAAEDNRRAHARIRLQLPVRGGVSGLAGRVASTRPPNNPTRGPPGSACAAVQSLTAAGVTGTVAALRAVQAAVSADGGVLPWAGDDPCGGWTGVYCDSAAGTVVTTLCATRPNQVRLALSPTHGRPIVLASRAP